MKTIQVVSWALWVASALFAALLLTPRTAGDDAAGWGMRSSMGLILLPVVLIAGALLFWSQRSASNTVRLSVFGVIALPFLIGACLFASNSLQQLSYRLGAAQAGRFSDTRLTGIARAIDRKDYAAERELLKQGTIDWAARDRLDATLLGHAVKRVRDDYAGNPPVDGVKILLANGAPLTDSATRPNEHLMETVFDGNSPGSLEMLKAILDAGGNANATDSFGLPLIHTTSCNLAKLKLLTEHGADLEAPNNRTDRPKWTPLMNAVYMREWDQALYLIQMKVSLDYRAPDGNTIDSVMEDCVKRNGLDNHPEPGYIQVKAALNRQENQPSNPR